MKKFLFMAVAAIGLLLGSCDKGDGGFDDGGDGGSTLKTATHKMVVTATGSSDVIFTYTVAAQKPNDLLSKIYLNGEYAGETVTKSTTIGSGQNLTFSTEPNALYLICALGVGGEEGTHAKITAKSYIDGKLSKEFEKSYNFTGLADTEVISLTTTDEE